MYVFTYWCELTPISLLTFYAFSSGNDAMHYVYINVLLVCLGTVSAYICISAKAYLHTVEWPSLGMGLPRNSFRGRVRRHSHTYVRWVCMYVCRYVGM
jgi:hypothetical protein